MTTTINNVPIDSLEDAKNVLASFPSPVKEHLFEALSAEREEQIVLREQKIQAGDLTTWREDMVTSRWLKKNYQNKYDNVIAHTLAFIADLQTNKKETDRYIELPCGLRLDKKSFLLDPQQEWNHDDILTYQGDDYRGGRRTMMGIRHRVLHDQTNSMYPVMQQAIQERTDEWRVPLTREYLDLILSVLPGETQDEKLLALEMVSWRFGRGILDPVEQKDGQVSIRAFMKLYRENYDRLLYTVASQHNFWSMFFVKKVKTIRVQS